MQVVDDGRLSPSVGTSQGDQVRIARKLLEVKHDFVQTHPGADAPKTPEGELERLHAIVPDP
jgi:hypothetical protein